MRHSRRHSEWLTVRNMYIDRNRWKRGFRWMGKGLYMSFLGNFSKIITLKKMSDRITYEDILLTKMPILL